MDADTADSLRLIATRLKAGRFDLGGGSWRFSLAPLSGRFSWPSEPFVVSMEWGGGRLHLLAGRATLALLYAHQFPQAPLDVFPQDLALAGFRLAWRDLATQLELLGGRRVRLIRAARAGADALEGAPFRFRLLLDSGPARDGVLGVLAADAPGLALLAMLARRQPVEPGVVDAETPIPLRLELGEMRIGVAALRALAVHDVLLPDTVIDSGTPLLWLRADSRHAARARLQGSSLVIEASLGKNISMPTPPDSAKGEDANSLAHLDEIEIRLSFDLGEKTLLLAELAALQPGQVLELEGALPRLVAIRANGRLIGRGELVRVADQVAVRVLELARPDESGTASATNGPKESD